MLYVIQTRLTTQWQTCRRAAVRIRRRPPCLASDRASVNRRPAFGRAPGRGQPARGGLDRGTPPALRFATAGRSSAPSPCLQKELDNFDQRGVISCGIKATHCYSGCCISAESLYAGIRFGFGWITRRIKTIMKCVLFILYSTYKRPIYTISCALDFHHETVPLKRDSFNLK